MIQIITDESTMMNTHCCMISNHNIVERIKVKLLKLQRVNGDYMVRNDYWNALMELHFSRSGEWPKQNNNCIELRLKYLFKVQSSDFVSLLVSVTYLLVWPKQTLFWVMRAPSK